MQDAVAILPEPPAQAYRQKRLADIAFADDTLPLGAAAEHVQQFAEAVARAGSACGLELHFDKFQ
eukprot:2083718-Pyramimonas_sp.AAC.1